MDRLTAIAPKMLQQLRGEPPPERRTDFQSRLAPPEVPTIQTRLIESPEAAAAATTLDARRLASPVMTIFRNAEANFERGSRALDEIISASEQHRELSPTTLLALQAQMYRYSEEVELLSKIVEKAVDGLKELLKTQV